MKPQFFQRLLVFVFLIACCPVINVNGQVTRRVPQRTTLQKLDVVKLRNAREIVKSAEFLRDPQKVVSMEGFFVHEPVPMLLTDMKWYYVNTPMPDSVYVPVRGTMAETLTKDARKYFGTYVRMEGNLTLEKRRTTIGEIEDAAIISTKIPVVLRERSASYVFPEIYNICQRYPKICQMGPILTKNYALLYSGGINSYNAHSRYWNDLKFMYKTLKSKYGYTDEQIVVVYKNGVAADAEMTVDYPASKTGVRDAINYLDSKVGTNSDLFFFITNHGGGYNTAENTNRGGVADAAPTDETDTWHYDETVYYYGETNNTITDDTLATWINRVVSSSGNKLTAVLEPCFSGGLIRDLRGTNHIVMSAANEFEYSWSGAPGDHDVFSYYFTCAVNGADHNGTAVNADTNGDGKVSMLEAFIYAKNHDTASEEPLLEDSGDGVGTHNPSATGTDGPAANATFL